MIVQHSRMPYNKIKSKDKAQINMLNRDKIIKGVKIAFAAVLAIAAAAELGLEYSATSGIITVLSIQNTKKETLNSARNRTLAYLCALLLSAASFYFLGFTLFAFACYLLLFALLCLYMGWEEAIAMDSVLITHFLAEQSMSAAMLINETALFFIGTTVGILVNMHLRKKKSLFEKLADGVDEQIKGILSTMAYRLIEDKESNENSDRLEQLKETLRQAMECALNNYNNALWKKDTSEVDYIQMREKQSIILQDIYDNLNRISCLPRQANQVGILLKRIENDYHRDNTVTELLQELDILLLDLKNQELPNSREEFETRAILFYILKQIERLLMIKREYVLTRGL
ncbi:aromatic acid exporter family protein [Novisyntrophococcus fermenticellae]|uniref:aromatic acid exporter family protein n=1 Tax=Novisyntrophococcus fermenticellae TaxID=2068655 RepID=UPI001E4B7481|nr:aromatic acid exporter family protein [Novisyntrophococcus fermenticellae]